MCVRCAPAQASATQRASGYAGAKQRVSSARSQKSKNRRPTGAPIFCETNLFFLILETTRRPSSLTVLL